MRKKLIGRIFIAACFLLCMPMILYAKEINPAKESTPLFRFEKVKKSDTLWKMFGTHWKMAVKINRISPERIKAGMKLKVPYDWNIAEQNAPVPRELPGMKGKLIFIDLHEQVFGAYENGILILWGPISSSAERVECGWAHEKKLKCITPTGNFSVLGKDRDRISNKYPPPHGGASMKYAVRFHEDYWIHAGALPGHPDSHGCVRVLNEDAQWLFQWTNRKTVIIIT